LTNFVLVYQKISHDLKIEVTNLRVIYKHALNSTTIF